MDGSGSGSRLEVERGICSHFFAPVPKSQGAGCGGE